MKIKEFWPGGRVPGTPGSANALDQLLIGYIPLVQCQSVFSAAIKTTVPCLVVSDESSWVVRGLHEAVVVRREAAVLLGSYPDVTDPLGLGWFRPLTPVRLLVNTATSSDRMSVMWSRCSTPRWLWVSLVVSKVGKMLGRKEFFTNSLQYKNANFASIVLAVSFDMKWTNKVFNCKMQTSCTRWLLISHLCFK